MSQVKGLINNFDRIGDWKKFSTHMVEYLTIPVKKYGAENKFNDLLHYTGLRVMCWHLLKYSLRLWLGFGKRHDFEKIAHYAQMGRTLATEQGREAPFFKVEDPDGDYLIIRAALEEIESADVYKEHGRRLVSICCESAPADLINRVAVLLYVGEYGEGHGIRAKDEFMANDECRQHYMDMAKTVIELTRKDLLEKVSEEESTDDKRQPKTP